MNIDNQRGLPFSLLLEKAGQHDNDVSDDGKEVESERDNEYGDPQQRELEVTRDVLAGLQPSSLQVDSLIGCHYARWVGGSQPGGTASE